MSYEISKITVTRPEFCHNNTIGSEAANIARYAIAAFKRKISNVFNSPENLFNSKFIQETIAAVDITPSCIYVCQIDNNSGSRALTGLASVCIQGKFVGEDILNNPNLYSENLKNLIRENKIQAKKVAVSLPVSSSIIKVATISRMNDIDISKAIKYGSLWQNLMSQDDSPENYSIFYQIIRRDDFSETMDILLVATKLSDIKLYKDIVIKSGLQPVIIDAKSIALHYAFKCLPFQNNKAGTVLIEFGLEDNYIMLMGNSRPKIFNIDVSELERAAILGLDANGDTEIVDLLIKRYSQKLDAIISSYNKINPQMRIEEIYVMSSLPLIGNFISKLRDSLNSCEVEIKECSMFDHLVVSENFTITKNSAKNNISAWAGAISTAIMPWQNKAEEWIEISKSPKYGTQFFAYKHRAPRNDKISFQIGDSYKTSNITNTKSTLARLHFYPNYIALAAAALTFLAIVKSYNGLLQEGRELASNDIALSSVVNSYKEKNSILMELTEAANKIEAVNNAANTIAQEQNQQYVLSMYNYLNTILQQGVWLKQLTFTAPNNIEIEGRSVDDEGVMSFLSTTSGSNMFAKMALKHIQSIKELDLYSANSISLKSFILQGSLSDTLPGDYLNKPNLVAGSMPHGG